MKTHIVIPARFASSRLPGKPLRLLAGITMIERVYRQAEKAQIGDITVATDDQRIFDHVNDFSGNVVMTLSNHISGTDRLAEVCEQKNWCDDDIVLNIQGDEPLIPPSIIQLIANIAQQTNTGITTLATKIDQADAIENPNIVKVVIDHLGKALYFSRAPIPWCRAHYPLKKEASLEALASTVFRHLGLYAYRVKTLKLIPTLPICAIERAESLEQLRPLFYGIPIQVGIIDKAPPHGVDTEADAQRIEALLSDIIH